MGLMNHSLITVSMRAPTHCQHGLGLALPLPWVDKLKAWLPESRYQGQKIG